MQRLVAQFNIEPNCGMPVISEIIYLKGLQVSDFILYYTEGLTLTKA